MHFKLLFCYTYNGGSNMTPHNEASKNDIAKTVIMPGDPLRAKMIAEKYLENYRLVNSIRNIYAYTGTYKGKKVTVMASGMGIPSMGIYSYELFKFYDVDAIIRVGSAGTYSPNLKLFDIVLASEVYSDSSFAKVQNGYDKSINYPSKELNEKIKESAQNLNIKINEGRIYCSEVFYKENNENIDMYRDKNCLCVEMESFSLFHNASVFGKKAACILTISDSLVTHEETTALERQNAFNQMIEIALNTI